jgi:hypothetical protein
MRPLIAVVVAALLCGGAEAKPTDRVLAEARRRLQQGNKQYEAGNYEPALRLYLAAYELVPSPDILFNIGLAREKVLDYEGCALAFQDYLAAIADEDPTRDRAAERYESCRARAEIQVKISSIPPGAAISIGVEAADSFRGRTPAQIKLTPGNYVVAVELPGYVPLTQTVAVDVGRQVEVDFPLEKLSTLAIEADVAGATVVLDGGEPLPAPVRRELRAGLHAVRVFKDGHRDVNRELRIEPGEQSTLLVTLPPLPVLRTLDIEVSADATVWLDGVDIGAAPVERAETAGPHRLEVRAPGHLPFARDIEIRDDRDTRLFVELSPERTPTERRVLWGLWGGAGVAAAGAAVYGWLALRDQSDFDAMPSLDLAERGDERARRSDLLWGTAAALAGTAVLYHVVTRPEPSRARER